MKMIPMVEALNMPREVEDWCIDNDITIHCGNDVVQIDTKEKNPLWEWVKEQGYKPNYERYQYAAVIGT